MASKAPTPERSALEKIAEWAQAEAGVTVGDDGALIVAGTPPLIVEVTADDERSQLIHTHRELGVADDRLQAVQQILPRRGSVVASTVSSDDTGLTAMLVATLYHDGLNRQAFVSTFNELVALADQIASSAPAAAPEVAVAMSPPQQEPAAPIVAPEPQPAAIAPVVVPAAAAIVAPAADDTAPTIAMPAVWVPTHNVPAGGMKAWPKPDPALAPIADLQARVELSIAERKGDWARVVGSNGWTGWVDARRLQVLGAAPAQPARAPGSGSAFATLPLAPIGAVVLGASAFLPWFSFQGFSVNALDIAVKFLWDVNAAGEPALGYLVLALGALALAAIFAPQVPSGLRRIAGIAGIAVAVVFVYQLNQGLGGSLWDTITSNGIGVYGAIIGGALLVAAPSANRS